MQTWAEFEAERTSDLLGVRKRYEEGEYDHDDYQLIVHSIYSRVWEPVIEPDDFTGIEEAGSW